MPDPTLMTAKDQAEADPGEAPVPPPANMGALGTAGPPQGNVPIAPTAFGGAGPTMGQISAIRDSVMAQFPSITTFDDPHTSMSPSEKIGLFAMALHNPQGAMAVIRGQQ